MIIDNVDTCFIDINQAFKENLKINYVYTYLYIYQQAFCSYMDEELITPSYRHGADLGKEKPDLTRGQENE